MEELIHLVKEIQKGVDELKHKLSRPELQYWEINIIKADIDSKQKDLYVLRDRVFGIYGDSLRPAQLELLSALYDMNQNLHDGALIRRSLLAAYYGVCIYSILDHPQVAHLKRNFPSLKLPVIVSQEDEQKFSELQYGPASLRETIFNLLKSYKSDERCRAEENLRSLVWAPVLSCLLNTLKTQFEKPELNFMLEYNMKSVPNYPWLRFADFAFAPENGGLPILLIELAAAEVPEGGYHKNLRKMSIMMAHILMELVQRAHSNCPDEDLSKFRVYGILVAGSQFELCVESVVKNKDGKINFMFHTNDKHWKFALFGNELFTDPYGLYDCVCSGFESDFGAFSEIEETSSKFSPDMFVQIDVEKSEDDEEDLEKECQPASSPFIEKSLVILWKYLTDMMAYYTKLPQCLKECILSGSLPVKDSSKRYSFPPRQLNPELAKSGLSHLNFADQSLPIQRAVRKIIASDSHRSVYELLLNCPFPTLPNVFMIDEKRNEVLVRKCFYSTSNFAEDFSGDKKIFRRKLAQFYGLVAGKFILDMLLAVNYLHGHGFVCGSVEPDWISFDGVYWQLSGLPRLCKVDDAQTLDEYPIPNYLQIFHIRSEKQSLSQRDDIYGIAKVSKLCLGSIISYAIDESPEIPFLGPFIWETFKKMKNTSKFPDLDTVSILTVAAPLYDALFESIDPEIDIPDYVVATRLLATKVYRDLIGGNSGSSIQTTSILSPETKKLIV